jgi:hypothetical protein
MDSSPPTVDIAKILELFGYSADDEGCAPVLHEMRDIEQAARRLMRTHLPPHEFAKIAALAEASAAAQTILVRLRVDA